MPRLKCHPSPQKTKAGLFFVRKQLWRIMLDQTAVIGANICIVRSTVVSKSFVSIEANWKTYNILFDQLVSTWFRVRYFKQNMQNVVHDVRLNRIGLCTVFFFSRSSEKQWCKCWRKAKLDWSHLDRSCPEHGTDETAHNREPNLSGFELTAFVPYSLRNTIRLGNDHGMKEIGLTFSASGPKSASFCSGDLFTRLYGFWVQLSYATCG